MSKNDYLLGKSVKVVIPRNQYKKGEVFKIDFTWGTSHRPIISRSRDENGIYLDECRLLKEVLVYRREE